MKNYFKILLFLISPLIFGQDINLIKVETIEFSGNEHFSNSELIDIIALRESPNRLLIFLGDEAAYFDSLLIGEELQRLRSFYFNHGFFKSKISANYIIDHSDHTAEVFFNIEEGYSTHYNKLLIHGLDSLEGNDFSSIMALSGIDTSEIYSYNKISEMNLNVIYYLRNNGYMFSSIDSTLIYIDTVQNKIDTDIFINPTHTQMGNQGKMKKRRDYFSKNGKIYISTSNFDLQKYLIKYSIHDINFKEKLIQKSMQYCVYNQQEIEGTILELTDGYIFKKYIVPDYFIS